MMMRDSQVLFFLRPAVFDPCCVSLGASRRVYYSFFFFLNKVINCFGDASLNQTITALYRCYLSDGNETIENIIFFSQFLATTFSVTNISSKLSKAQKLIMQFSKLFKFSFRVINS